MSRALHFQVLAVVCILMLGLVSSADAENGQVTAAMGVGRSLKSCTYNWWSDCQLNTKRYVTRTGYSSGMNVGRCAEYCIEDDDCYSFNIYYRSSPNGVTGSCSLWKDTKPKRKYQQGSYCGILKC